MILSNLNHNFLITENDPYGIYKEFSYVDQRGNQRKKNPTILYLGTKPGKDDNQLICGIALDYLNHEEYTRLRSKLTEIMAATGKARYEIGKRLLPDIFAGDGIKSGSSIPHSSKSGGGGAFRSYVKSRVAGMINKKMLALKVEPEDQVKANKLAQDDGLEWEEIPDEVQKQYLEQASRKRGEEELEYETFKKEIQPKEIEPEEPEEEPEPKQAPIKKPTKTQTAAPIVTPKPPTKQMTRIEPEIEPAPIAPPKNVAAKLKKAPQPTMPVKVNKAQRPDQSTNAVDKETKEQNGAPPNEDVT